MYLCFRKKLSHILKIIFKVPLKYRMCYPCSLKMSMNASVPWITSANNYVRTLMAAMCVPVERDTTKSERQTVQVHLLNCIFDMLKVS